MLLHLKFEIVLETPFKVVSKLYEQFKEPKLETPVKLIFVIWLLEKFNLVIFVKLETAKDVNWFEEQFTTCYALWGQQILEIEGLDNWMCMESEPLVCQLTQPKSPVR